MFTYKNIENTMKDFKFPLGTKVAKVNTTLCDSIFGINSKDVGIVVGYDEENDYYRVYYNKHNCYFGAEEKELVECFCEINEELKEIRRLLKLKYDFKIITEDNEEIYFMESDNIFGEIQQEIDRLKSDNKSYTLYQRTGLLSDYIIIKRVVIK